MGKFSHCALWCWIWVLNRSHSVAHPQLVLIASQVLVLIYGRQSRWGSLVGGWWASTWHHIHCCFLFVCETGCHYAVQASLKLRSSWFHLLSTRIISMHNLPYFSLLKLCNSCSLLFSFTHLRQLWVSGCTLIHIFMFSFPLLPNVLIHSQWVKTHTHMLLFF